MRCKFFCSASLVGRAAGVNLEGTMIGCSIVLLLGEELGSGEGGRPARGEGARPPVMVVSTTSRAGEGAGEG
jgi:hypothetical protein